RHSFTYGKVALGGSVVHFDVQGGGDLGTLLTDRALTPAACGFVGLVARLRDRLYGQLDLTVVGSLEHRSSSVFAVGFLPVLTVGGWLSSRSSSFSPHFSAPSGNGTSARS